MSFFKEKLRTDLVNVWFSELEEFWEIHDFDGKKIKALIDEGELMKRTAKKIYSSDDGIVFEHHKLVMLLKDDFGYIPAVGAEIKLDGKRMYVVRAEDEAGILSIELEAYAS